MWCSSDTLNYMFKAEFVALASLKVQSGKAESGLFNSHFHVYLATSL